MNKKILVTGGAGYIGSVTVKQMLEKGMEVVVFDNLEYGHKEAVTCPLITGDLLDSDSLQQLDSYSFDAVIHFAAYLQVGESMQNPYKYYQNNILGGLNLLEFMKKKNIHSIVFSSTAAIFGTPAIVPIMEDAPKHPENVYGETKLAFEKALMWYDKIFSIKSSSLRYFNAAGATMDGSLGEAHNPETHIIPLAIRAALSGKEFSIFGNDYDTKDGTCIRDYIHVEDLATAHILALLQLEKNSTSTEYNLGTGIGHSNLEIIEMVKKISKKDFPVIFKDRRLGDPAVLLADNKKAKDALGWHPMYSDVETIIQTAYNWHAKHA